MILTRDIYDCVRSDARNGTWAGHGVSVGGQLSILNMYKHLAHTRPHASPRLGVGDMVVFSKCTVHTCSGDNTLGRPRHAWQIRLFSEPQLFIRGLNKAYPGIGHKYLVDTEYIAGPKYMRVWPGTVEDEDVVRRQGHMTLSRAGEIREYNIVISDITT